MDISLADGIGHLTQWDIGRTMQVSGVDGPYMVHFYTSRLSRALVVPPQADGSVAVPNLVLQSSAPLMVAVFRQDGPDEPGKTILIKEFCIRAKAKPEDYSYVENIGYINWVDKKAELEAYMQELIRLRNSGAFDGVSPAVTVEKRVDGHIVTITDRTGPHTFFVADGQGSAVEIDPTLTDATKAAQAKATGDGIRTAQETADTAKTTAETAAKAAATALETAQGKQDKIKPPGVVPGQLIRVKAISDDGDITDWDAVDMPSGGEYRHITDVPILSDGTRFVVNLEVPLRKCLVYISQDDALSVVTGAIRIGFNSRKYILQTGSALSTSLPNAIAELSVDGELALGTISTANKHTTTTTYQVYRKLYFEANSEPITQVEMAVGTLSTGSVVRIWGVPM